MVIQNISTVYHGTAPGSCFYMMSTLMKWSFWLDSLNRKMESLSWDFIIDYLPLDLQNQCLVLL